MTGKIDNIIGEFNQRIDESRMQNLEAKMLEVQNHIEGTLSLAQKFLHLEEELDSTLSL